MNLSQLVKTVPPSYPDHCLSEGRKQIQFDLEFELTDFVAPCQIPFPSYRGKAIGYSAEYDIQLSSVQNVTLTAIQGILLTWVPVSGDQILIIDSGDGCPITVAASLSGDLLGLFHLRIPLYCAPDQTVRIYLFQQTDPATLDPFFGDIDLTFVNYQLPPICIQSASVFVG